MTAGEIQSAYEWNTGQVIVRRFAALDPMEIPAVLVHGHGPFCWATSARRGVGPRGHPRGGGVHRVAHAWR